MINKYDFENKSTKEVLRIIDKYLTKEKQLQKDKFAKEMINMFYGFIPTTKLKDLCVPKFITLNRFWKFVNEFKQVNRIQIGGLRLKNDNKTEVTIKRGGLK